MKQGNPKSAEDTRLNTKNTVKSRALESSNQRAYVFKYNKLYYIKEEREETEGKRMKMQGSQTRESRCVDATNAGFETRV